MTFFLVLTLVLLVVAGLWTVLARSLIGAAISLGAVSLLLSILMFLFLSPLAAVFELSVCAGLITVVFVSTVSLTNQQSRAEMVAGTQERMARYWPLPLVLVLVAVVALALGLPHITAAVRAVSPETVGEVLWTTRATDLFGQMAILLAGAYAIVVFFKQRGQYHD